jgi:hypothetical protein
LSGTEPLRDMIDGCIETVTDAIALAERPGGP